MDEDFQSSRRGPSFWIPWLTAVAIGIIAIILSTQNRALNDELRDESRMVTNLAAKASHAQQVLEVLTSPSAQKVTLTATANAPVQPNGRVTYLMDRGGLLFQASNLKAPPAGMIYQLWVLPANDQAPISAGIFSPDALGSVSLVMPPLVPGIAAKSFEVTLEKAGGSQTPTLPQVLAGVAPVA